MSSFHSILECNVPEYNSCCSVSAFEFLLAIPGEKTKNREEDYAKNGRSKKRRARVCTSIPRLLDMAREWTAGLGVLCGTARTDKIMKREAVSQLLKYRSLKYEENG
ncbi:hypothetical protein C5167_011743 [Papaver somniferum]|nr:hypothetical protein C5167_011743 [Papaver somniferum]